MKGRRRHGMGHAVLATLHGTLSLSRYLLPLSQSHLPLMCLGILPIIPATEGSSRDIYPIDLLPVERRREVATAKRAACTPPPAVPPLPSSPPSTSTPSCLLFLSSSPAATSCHTHVCLRYSLHYAYALPGHSTFCCSSMVWFSILSSSQREEEGGGGRTFCYNSLCMQILVAITKLLANSRSNNNNHHTPCLVATATTTFSYPLPMARLYAANFYLLCLLPVTPAAAFTRFDAHAAARWRCCCLRAGTLCLPTSACLCCSRLAWFLPFLLGLFARLCPPGAVALFHACRQNATRASPASCLSHPPSHACASALSYTACLWRPPFLHSACVLRGCRCWRNVKRLPSLICLFACFRDHMFSSGAFSQNAMADWCACW